MIWNKHNVNTAAGLRWHLDNGPAVLTDQQRADILNHIKTMTHNIAPKVSSIDLSRRPENKVWTTNGPVSQQSLRDDILKSFDELQNLLNSGVCDFRTISRALDLLEFIELAVAIIARVQRQATFYNWLYARIPFPER